MFFMPLTPSKAGVVTICAVRRFIVGYLGFDCVSNGFNYIYKLCYYFRCL